MKKLFYVELMYGNVLVDENANMIQYTHENDGVISYETLKPLMDHAGVAFVDIGVIEPEDVGLDPDEYYADEPYFAHEQLYVNVMKQRIAERKESHEET